MHLSSLYFDWNPIEICFFRQAITGGHGNTVACGIYALPSLTLMMTSSNGNIFRVTGLCAGNSPVPGEFPTQRPVTRSIDVFFDLRLNKRLSKQSWCWWLETLSRPLWRHCNELNQNIEILVIIHWHWVHWFIRNETVETFQCDLQSRS